ncbi:MAG: hypothetical protein BGO01_06210 [Armatimonadetes bacterium 55-13]|nr:VOC family protein [Armatimonadota bacterium]OJU65075.1 MAG: hypothetical protein BGO01_06210 [Armatimonadetes bacterium 55-13]
MAYKVCHIEWLVTDLNQAQKFYGTLFDWEFKAFGEEMIVFGTGSEHIGGFMKADEVVPGNSPSVWLECASIDEVMAKVEPAGGQISVPKAPLPGVGFSAAIKDPEGNPIGLVEFAR